MSDRRLYRNYRRRRSQPDVAGIIASILLGVGLITIPHLIASNEATKKVPVGHSQAPHFPHHVRVFPGIP
jgi:hypothetical protein